jgi:hypothetical protein
MERRGYLTVRANVLEFIGGTRENDGKTLQK